MRPQNIAVTSTERCRSGAYSELSVTAMGIAPPSPMPVTKRSAASVVSELASTQLRQAAPNRPTLTSRIVLRP